MMAMLLCAKPSLVSHATYPVLPQQTSESISVVAVGDIMMGTVHPESVLPPDDGKDLFLPFIPIFAQSDLVFGNIEGPLADKGKPDKCKGSKSGRCFEFMMPPRYAKHIADAGFTVVSIANNHVYDAGSTGARQTVSALQWAGIEPAGGEITGITETKGKRIAVLGFSFKYTDHSYSILDIPLAQRMVKKALEANNLVIVSFHGGAEGPSAAHIGKGAETFLGENRGNVVRFARAMIDAGAAMVIGHGPHVLRAAEIYRNRLIAYSLGNFLTYKLFNVKGPSGISVVLRAEIDPETGAFKKGLVVPVQLSRDGIPSPDADRKAIKILNNLSAGDLPFTGVHVDQNGTIIPRL